MTWNVHEEEAPCVEAAPYNLTSGGEVTLAAFEEGAGLRSPLQTRGSLVSPAVQRLFGQTIEALISMARLNDASWVRQTERLRALEAHASEVPGKLMEDLRPIAASLAQELETSPDELSSEYEREVTADVFSL